MAVGAGESGKPAKNDSWMMVYAIMQIIMGLGGLATLLVMGCTGT